MNSKEHSIEEEKMSVAMYREYGIAEWYEKCLVMTSVEKLEVLKNIRNGENSLLVQLVRLPFPHFVREYFERIYQQNEERRGIAVYLNDPAFGYKMYMLTEKMIERFSESLRSTLSGEAVALLKDFSSSSFREIMDNTLDQSLVTCDSGIKSRGRLMKYVYLTQYITYDEALKMNLSISKLFQKDREAGVMEDGFELENKLDTLNPIARTIFARMIGLYGQKRMKRKEISTFLDVSVERIGQLYDEIFSYFLRTLGEFKNKLGFVERNYAPNDIRMYNNKYFREIDLKLTIGHILKNMLSPEEQKVVSSLNYSKAHLYIAYKYLFNQDYKLTSDYLINASLSELELGDIGGKGAI